MSQVSDEVLRNLIERIEFIANYPTGAISEEIEAVCDQASIALRELLDLRAKAAAGRWQQIDTAPKDGTVIDLWDATIKRRICNAKWGYHYWLNGRPTHEKSWGRDDRDGPFCDRPTHWMPLPAAPEAEKP